MDQERAKRRMVEQGRILQKKKLHIYTTLAKLLRSAKPRMRRDPAATAGKPRPQRRMGLDGGRSLRSPNGGVDLVPLKIWIMGSSGTPSLEWHGSRSARTAEQETAFWR